MRRYLGIGAAWLGATVLSVVIASAAVAGIRDRVVETPVAIGAPTSTTTTTAAGEMTSTEAPAPPLASSSTTTSSTVTSAPPSETTSTTTTAPTETTTTTSQVPPATTTTTAPPTTTTTAPVSYSTYDLIGGTVVLAFGNGQVNLVSATPRTGFSVDAEHTGPTEVEVEFVSNDHKSELSAHIDNGELKVETEEESRGDEED